MANGSETIQINMDVNPNLWANAKIQAIKEKIDLKDFVARAIRNELQRVTTEATSSKV